MQLDCDSKASYSKELDDAAVDFAPEGGAPPRSRCETQREEFLYSPAKPRTLIESLATSRIYQDYELAFSGATGLPVALLPVDACQLVHHGKSEESPFCALVAGKSKAAVVCLRVLEKLLAAARQKPATVVCEAGMCLTAVPVKLGDKVVGYLQTGQVFHKPPTEAQFDRVRLLAQEWGVEATPQDLRDCFFRTRVITPQQHAAIVKLLVIFAQHLSMLSNELVMQQESIEPPALRRAKEYITKHQSEDLTMGGVAKALTLSPFYFCKMFRKAMGITFTDYLSRMRIEKSKILLLNPNLRVGEIAFEVGFQSLTHFNRVFKRVTGQSPTEYRAKVLGN